MQQEEIQRIVDEETRLIEFEIQEDPQLVKAQEIMLEIGNRHTQEFARRIAERLESLDYDGDVVCSAWLESRTSTRVELHPPT